MNLIALAQQATNILLPALPFIYAGKDAVTGKVKDMLLEKGIEKLGAKSIDRAKVLLDKIRSKESESIEKSFEELSQNPEDLKAKNELQQEILKLLIANPGLAEKIEFNINQFAVGDHNTLINFDNSSKQNFENCKFEGNVFGNSSYYTDNSQDILRQLQNEQQIKDIENRLEKFYIPADDVINLKHRRREYTVNGYRRNTDCQFVQGLQHLKKYSYLADEDTYEAYEKYMSTECTTEKPITCQDTYKNLNFNQCENYTYGCHHNWSTCPHNLEYCEHHPDHGKSDNSKHKDKNKCTLNNAKCIYIINLKKKIEKDIEDYKNELLELKNNRR